MAPSVLLLSNHLSQPGHARRLRALQALGFSGVSAGYSRSMYEESGLLAGYEPIVLRTIESGRYLRRAARVPMDASTLANRFKIALNDFTLVWCFGLDMAALALWLRSRQAPGAHAPPIALELSDVRGRKRGTWLTWAARVANRVAEDLLLPRVDGVVVTAPRHLELLDIPSAFPTLVAPNRMDDSWNLPRPSTARVDDNLPVRIGVIGFFRYLPIVARMVEAAQRHYPRLEVHFFGDGSPDAVRWVRQLCERYSCAQEHGPYRVPDELPTVYGSIDMTWAVYDTSDANVLTAIPNKLFESTWFGKPLFVASGTELEAFAARLRAGIIPVGATSVSNLEHVLGEVMPRDLVRLSKNALAVPEEDLVSRPEELLPFLQELKALPHLDITDTDPA